MGDLLALVLVLSTCALALWLSTRFEPHWVSRDGHRFITRAQPIHADGTIGRWREVRVTVTGDQTLLVSTRGRIGASFRGEWTVVGRSPDPPRNSQIFLLRGHPDLALKLPGSSRALPVLEQALEATAP